jgi:hypothetical protein
MAAPMQAGEAADVQRAQAQQHHHRQHTGQAVQKVRQHVVADLQRGGVEQVEVVREPGVAQPRVDAQRAVLRDLARIGQVVHQLVEGGRRRERRHQRGQRHQRQRDHGDAVGPTPRRHNGTGLQCTPFAQPCRQLQRGSHHTCRNQRQRGLDLEDTEDGQRLEGADEETDAQATATAASSQASRRGGGASRASTARPAPQQLTTKTTSAA